MLLGKTMKLTTIPLALLAVLCLGGNPDSCDALSIQSDRRINHGCAKSPDHEDSDVSPKLFNVKCPPPHLSIHNFSFPEPVVSTGRRKKISIHSRSNIFREIHEQRTPLPRCSLLHSLAVVASCRRLSFFILSVSLVNYIRSSVLKIPKSSKHMFDECPWPFLLFHDPIKFLKDGSTHIMLVWLCLCQIYSQIGKVRSLIL